MTMSEPPESGPVDIGSEGRPVPAFSVVGLGASAGGLAAFEAFFTGIPKDSEPGMAFVLIQHLDPDHESLLTGLIRRYTHLEACEVEDGMEVEPNRVYILPPRHEMVLREGRLRLRDPGAPRGHRFPIDRFLHSLAEELGEWAVGVILSGTGADGTLGARAIREAGGLVLVEDPESTREDGMPQSAIAAEVASHVLPASQMAEWLAREADPRGREETGPSDPLGAPQAEDGLRGVLDLVRQRTGHDFSQYKESSIRRRLERKMADREIGSFDEYVRHLNAAPDEVEELFGDLLIGVTRFFRDPIAFDALLERGVPHLLGDRAPGATLRVWVPGCSTGQEAYSIAILLQECMDRSKQFRRVQVFATDISSRAVGTARAGVYPAEIAEDVTAERLERFFSPVEGGTSYRIQKGIRDLVIFSEQDLIVDPPFSRVDLISCRNLLIYLVPDLQRKVLGLLHYALNPGGLLLLGSSETVGDLPDHFENLDRAGKLFRKRDAPLGSSPSRSPAGLMEGGDRVGVPRRPWARTATPPERSLRERTEQELLAHHAPAAVLVNAAGDVLYVHGRTGRFLEPAVGSVGMNVLAMARQGLKRSLASAFHQAVMDGTTVARKGLGVQTEGGTTTVDFTVRGVPGAESNAPGPDWFLVTFEAAPAGMGTCETGSENGTGTRGNGLPPSVDGSPSIDSVDVAALEKALQIAEDYLAVIETQLQTSGEESRSTIEELQSTNEELQSTNEELETSKEELQSVGEELSTVNAELETKVADLVRAEADMQNLLAGTGIGTLFVDADHRIQRFTPAITRLLQLIPGDVGRPVGDLATRFVAYRALEEDTAEVLRTLVPREVEVRTGDGLCYLLRILPYRLRNNVVNGAVITFTDITEVMEAREALRRAGELHRLAVVVRDANDAVTVQDLMGGLIAWNPGAERMYGWSETEALGMSYESLLPQDGRPAAQALLSEALVNPTLEPARTSRVAKDGSEFTVWLTATPLIREGGEVYALATTERRATSVPGAVE